MAREVWRGMATRLAWTAGVREQCWACAAPKSEEKSRW